MISCFTLEMSRTTSSEWPEKISSDLAQHRKAVVEAVVHDPVQQVSGAIGEVLLPQLLLLPAALEQVLDRLQRLVRNRDQVVRTDEDVQLAGVQAADGAVEDRKVQDDEQIVGVLVDLRALVARQDVLEVEGVESELLLEPRALEGRGALDVDPTQPLGGDRLDVGLALRGLRRGRGELAGTGGPSYPRLGEVPHRLHRRSSSLRPPQG
jgi:hypothetical protein